MSITLLFTVTFFLTELAHSMFFSPHRKGRDHTLSLTFLILAVLGALALLEVLPAVVAVAPLGTVAGWAAGRAARHRLIHKRQ